MHVPLPTPLVAVEVADEPRPGVPPVVLTDDEAGETRKDDEGRWRLGVGGGKPAHWRRAGAALTRELAGSGARFDVELTDAADAESVRAFVLGAVLGGYKFALTSGDAPERVESLRLVVPDEGYTDVLAAEAFRAHLLASATAFNRDLANAPSNVKDPAWVAAAAVDAARGTPGLQVQVRDEKWLAKRGFGGVLAVGGGSTRPPRLVELTWRGGDGPHVVLVGKGITFDTGGISIKPADGMHLMRTDMSGGAAVIAAVVALARRGSPVRVTGLVPLAENHVSGSAYRPGDVVRQYGGTTTEIGNTDAEGRLVLADALAYAVDELEPDVLVDVATLTGAMKVALGLRTGGLFSSSDAVAEALADAGERVGEAWWRMPLLEDHADDVRGQLADLRQTPPGPGGITAALFLREFTGGLPWAHLDIAGPARAEDAHDEVVPGATGFSARTLVEFVEAYKG
ncbi:MULTISPECIES: leucyl aminopeptidase [Actinosynnema]|uniref:leucyl aminopeptidase family protein n=1 Tax=Actinosynnema TaxID=40566 RepID=UPI0020A358FC|nr:leucyl aminopeptidase [Actinosynnema pretiosum]MCP2096132.1 leucyl aminopeptidase [Actinosynnema pretiosum]